MKYYKICPNCSYFCREEEKDEFCSFCGSELKTACKKCGEKIGNPYAIHCKKCGEKYRNERDKDKAYKF